MEEDDILYQSIIADPEQVSPDVDVSGLRTQTETSPQLLAAVSEYPGLQFDPTQYSAYSDLMDLYSTGLPMIETSTVETPAITTPVVETEGGGGGSQGTGDLVQDLVPTEDEQIITPTTEPNVFEGSPFIETSPNVLSAVNAAGEPIPGNIVDPITGNIFAPGDYSDVAGTTSDPREVIDVAAPASQFVDQNFMEDDYGIYDPNVPTSSILDSTFTAPAIDTVDPDQFAGGIAQETFLPDDFAQPTLGAVGTGDASIAEQIAAADRAAAITPQELPVEPPINTATIDAQTADELAQQPILTPDEPGILDTAVSGVSTAAQNAFEAVRSGASTAGDFITTYGYPVYQALQGNLAAAGASFLTGLTPLALGANFAGKIFESVGDTKSKQEYDSYTSEQQSEIDKAYAPGGVMEGYNAVSQFGKGVSGTVQDRIDKLEEVIANPNRDTSNVYTIDKDGNKIFTPSFNSAEKQLAELKNLQDKGGLTKRPTQDEIYDRDDIDPADVGLIAAGSADIQDFADIMPDELPNVTDPVEDFEVSGDIAPDGSAQVLDTAFGSVPSPNPAIADAALSGSFYVDDSSSDDSAPTGVDAGTADVQDYADIAPEPSPSGDSGSSGGGGKIVCTMMNETYGFGSFRNKIWLRQSKDLAPEYQKGYHKIFLPLVKLSKTNKIIRKILEHIAVHRTIDIRQESRGKTHILGRVYRKVLEPICYLVGKYAKR